MLDLLDKRILSFLQKDSKITIKELSVHLALSATAVYERIRKMERQGIIDLLESGRKEYLSAIESSSNESL